MGLEGVKRPQIAMKRGRSKVLPANEFIFLKAKRGDITPRGTQKKSLGIYGGRGLHRVYFFACLLNDLFLSLGASFPERSIVTALWNSNGAVPSGSVLPDRWVRELSPPPIQRVRGRA